MQGSDHNCLPFGRSFMFYLKLLVQLCSVTLTASAHKTVFSSFLWHVARLPFSKFLYLGRAGGLVLNSWVWTGVLFATSELRNRRAVVPSLSIIFFLDHWLNAEDRFWRLLQQQFSKRGLWTTTMHMAWLLVQDAYTRRPTNSKTLEVGA